MAIEFEGVSSLHPKAQTEAANKAAQEVEQTKRVQESTEPVSRQDTVSLTGTATRLRELEESVANLPVVDTQRVDAIRKSLATGEFQVDASRVADKLLNFEQDLNGASGNQQAKE